MRTAVAWAGESGVGFRVSIAFAPGGMDSIRCPVFSKISLGLGLKLAYCLNTLP